MEKNIFIEAEKAIKAVCDMSEDLYWTSMGLSLEVQNAEHEGAVANAEHGKALLDKLHVCLDGVHQIFCKIRGITGEKPF